jgi:hypothetical protein
MEHSKSQNDQTHQLGRKSFICSVLPSTAEPHSIEIGSFDPENPKATFPWNPLPPELIFVQAGSGVRLYDPSGNPIWIVPAETRLLMTTFAYANDWRWIITVDGQHSGFVQMGKENELVPFTHAKKETGGLPIIHGYGCASIPGIVSTYRNEATGMTESFQLPICGQ